MNHGNSGLAQRRESERDGGEKAAGTDVATASKGAGETHEIGIVGNGRAAAAARLALQQEANGKAATGEGEASDSRRQAEQTQEGKQVGDNGGETLGNQGNTASPLRGVDGGGDDGTFGGGDGDEEGRGENVAACKIGGKYSRNGVTRAGKAGADPERSTPPASAYGEDATFAKIEERLGEAESSGVAAVATKVEEKLSTDISSAPAIATAVPPQEKKEGGRRGSASPNAPSSNAAASAAESGCRREDERPGLAAVGRGEGAQPQPIDGEEGKGEERGRGMQGLAEALAPRRRDCPAHALPAARKFFDFNSVSSFEMRMLPEFFTGRSASKTPEVSVDNACMSGGRDGGGGSTHILCRR